MCDQLPIWPRKSEALRLECAESHGAWLVDPRWALTTESDSVSLGWGPRGDAGAAELGPHFENPAAD